MKRILAFALIAASSAAAFATGLVGGDQPQSGVITLTTDTTVTNETIRWTAIGEAYAPGSRTVTY